MKDLLTKFCRFRLLNGRFVNRPYKNRIKFSSSEFKQNSVPLILLCVRLSNKSNNTTAAPEISRVFTKYVDIFPHTYYNNYDKVPEFFNGIDNQPIPHTAKGVSFMTNANNYCCKTDSDTLDLAIANRGPDGIVVIPPRVSDIEPERNFWLIDRAVLIPENTTIVLQNCKIKLSDRCRDNFFRTANCGFGFPDPAPIRNVHLRGEGLCILEGADHPRATGDSSKLQHNPCPHHPADILAIDADWVPAERKASGQLDFWDVHNHSYGTDAGNPDESQWDDWRGIGVLFARAQNFSIENLKIVESHGWGISLEDCSFGTSPASTLTRGCTRKSTG